MVTRLLILICSVLRLTNTRAFTAQRARRQIGLSPFDYANLGAVGGLGAGTSALSSNGNSDGFNLLANGLAVGPFYNQGTNVGFRPGPTGFGFNAGQGGSIPVICMLLNLPPNVCALQTGTGFDLNVQPFANIFSGLTERGAPTRPPTWPQNAGNVGNVPYYNPFANWQPPTTAPPAGTINPFEYYLETTQPTPQTTTTTTTTTTTRFEPTTTTVRMRVGPGAAVQPS